MAEVHGSCDERFSAVRDALARNLDGDELGASVAVDLDGETVVDLWGGSRDEERTTPWTEDTIVNGWSTTKTVLSLAALMLVDRGELDVYAPAGDYWPEFSAKGKKDVEVRHLMSHTSGVSGWDPPFSIKDMYDWEFATRAAGRAGAVVGAGDGVGLPGQEPGAPGRRADPADHRAQLLHAVGLLVEDQVGRPGREHLVLVEGFRFGIGYCLGPPLIPYVPEGRTFFWGGWGGSLVIMDLDRRLTVSYLMNRMAPGILGSDRAESYVHAMYDAVS